MGTFKLNPATNKWEPITNAQKNDSDLRRIASASGLSLQQVLHGTDKQSIAARKNYEKTTATSSTPYGTASASYGSMSLAEPAKDKTGAAGRTWIGRDPSATAPVVPDAPMSGQDNIDSMWQAVYDEASAYQQIYGEQPPASWWDARTTPIENAQKRYDVAGKGTSGTAAAAKETERINKVKGGQAGEKFLRDQATVRKTEMLKRVAETFDPMQQATQTQLTAVLKNASDAFDLAEKQIGTAKGNFDKNFKASTAYEGVPISTYSVADNPLLAALQQQGAGTEQVTAATNLANQTAKQTSDLQKWAMSQLNTGEQNYGSAVQNAAQLGTTAALQGLGARKAEVQTGINTQFADQLAQLAKERATAGSNVDATIADIISKADEMAAKTQADYGSLPVKKTTTKKSTDTTPVVDTTKKKKPKPDIAAAVVTK
jgi:hypothetical protein